MKTQNHLQKKTIQVLGILGLMMIMTLVTNPLMAQTERTIKGVVTDEVGPLENATVLLKGTNIAVDTDTSGEFTFPVKLKDNDILEIIQLGYKKKKVVIAPNTDFLEILMSDYDIVIVGSLMMGSNATPELEDSQEQEHK